MAGCCKSKSTFILYTVNLLLLLLGIALTAVAGIIKANRGDLVNDIPGITEADVDAFMPASAANFGIAGGALLLVVSIVGLCGAKNYDAACGKMLLIVYALFLFVVMAIEIVAVAVTFSLTGTLNKFNNAKANEADAKIKQFVNQTMTACCFKHKSSKGCQLLGEVISTSNCGNYDAFKSALVKFINGKIRMVGIVAIVVAVVQFATLCATCCLLFRGKDKKEEVEQNNEFYAQGNYQPPAGNAATAQPVQYS